MPDGPKQTRGTDQRMSVLRLMSQTYERPERTAELKNKPPETTRPKLRGQKGK